MIRRDLVVKQRDRETRRSEDKKKQNRFNVFMFLDANPQLCNISGVLDLQSRVNHPTIVNTKFPIVM